MDQKTPQSTCRTFALATLLVLAACSWVMAIPDRPSLEPNTEDKPGHVRILGEHENFFTARFSPDGRLAVSGGGGELTLGTNQWVPGTDFDVRIWDVKTGAVLHRLKHTAAVFAVFSPDSKQVLTTSGNTIRIWDARSGELVRTHNFPFSVGWAAWSVDNKYWCIGCGDRAVRLFESSSGKLLRSMLGHTDPRIESVAFAPGNKRVLSSGFDGSVRLWDVETGRLERVVTANSGYRVRQAAWLPDAQSFVSGGADNIVHIWSSQGDRRLLGHTSYVESVAVSPDGRRILSASLDGTIRLWDVKTGKELHRFENFHIKGRHATILHIVFSPDGRHALSSGWDKTLRLWRLPD